MQEVKAIDRVPASSVSDVLMVSVAGAIGSYLRWKGDAVPQSGDIGAGVSGFGLQERA